eukprot:2564845-Rhodomonas_salina.1
MSPAPSFAACVPTQEQPFVSTKSTSTHPSQYKLATLSPSQACAETAASVHCEIKDGMGHRISGATRAEIVVQHALPRARRSHLVQHSEIIAALAATHSSSTTGSPVPAIPHQWHRAQGISGIGHRESVA